MDSERSERIRYFGFAAFVGVLLLLNLTGYFRTIFGIDTAAILTVLAGYRIFFNSIAALLEKEISADLAICIAVIAALVVGQYLAAAEAMFIMLVGEGLEAYAAGRTSAAIHRFVEQMPRRARKLVDGEEQEVDASSLVPGDLIAVRAGERIPADGVVQSGISSVDESTITGEALPREKEIGEEVYSGTLNGNGLLRIQVTRSGDETTLSRVVALVEEAREQRAPVERLADRYARYFLPALLLAAAGTFYFTGDWLRTVAVLIVACPCALILATPTAMVSAIGGLARRGILVRGGTVLQQAAKVDTVVFDKTGTITSGQFEILRVIALTGTETGIIRLAAAAESGSDHVLARVIAAEATRRGVKLQGIEHGHILPGRGAECMFEGRTIRAGSAAFLAEHGIEGADPLLEAADRLGATAVLVAEEGDLAGAILLRDRIREGVRPAIEQSKQLDITYQVMLTGDRRRAAEVIGREAGIPDGRSRTAARAEARSRAPTFLARAHGRHGRRWHERCARVCRRAGRHRRLGRKRYHRRSRRRRLHPHSLENLPKLFDVSRRSRRHRVAEHHPLRGLVQCGRGRAGRHRNPFAHRRGGHASVSSFFVMINSLRLLRVERTGWRWLNRTPLPAAWTFVRHKLEAFDVRDAFVRLIERWREFVRPAAIAAVALIVLSGVHIIGPAQVGIVERFGRRLVPYEAPGLHYRFPWPIDQLTRIQAKQVRTVEIGFRSAASKPDSEPAAYEWNVQHRSGRFQSRPEESLMLAGDQNMME